MYNSHLFYDEDVTDAEVGFPRAAARLSSCRASSRSDRQRRRASSRSCGFRCDCACHACGGCHLASLGRAYLTRRSATYLRSIWLGASFVSMRFNEQCYSQCCGFGCHYVALGKNMFTGRSRRVKQDGGSRSTTKRDRCSPRGNKRRMCSYL